MTQLGAAGALLWAQEEVAHRHASAQLRARDLVLCNIVCFSDLGGSEIS
jgi:hypothetical protein